MLFKKKKNVKNLNVNIICSAVWFFQPEDQTVMFDDSFE